jgi:OOP family OmpA-OmpF porin
MKQCPRASLEIRGYADARGKAERSRRLSLRRARAVADYLDRAGVPRERLVSAGSERPGATGDDPRARAEQRRARAEEPRVQIEVR